MHLTIRTKRLFFHKWTLLTSLFCIIRKSLTFWTHLPLLSFFLQMVFPAVQPDHFFYDILFFLSFLFDFIHLTIPLLHHSVTFLPVLTFSLEGRNITGGIPHNYNTYSSDWYILHRYKADCHDYRYHSDNLAFYSHCHGFFLNKAVQMFLV